MSINHTEKDVVIPIAEPLERTTSTHSYREQPESQDESDKEPEIEEPDNNDNKPIVVPEEPEEPSQINKELENLHISDNEPKMAIAAPSNNAGTASVPVQVRNLVPDPTFFNGNHSKFEDWWRAMKLFIKFNGIDNKAN